MIYQLTYTSKAHRFLNDNDLRAILEVSTKNNTALNISGCLLFFDATFYQIIEGEEQEVLSLFEKIRHDERHTDVKLMATNTAENPLYRNWGMLFSTINKQQTTEQETEQFKSNLLLLEEFTETHTEAEIWFWREIKKDLLRK